MHFDADYREGVTLATGLRVRFRLVMPSDKPRLAAGFERLSKDSRYRRFFVHKKALSPAELQFFTEPDGTDHIAIGAVELNEDGEESDGVGIGRILSLSADRNIGELALVVDARQGLGIGRMLLERLLAAAAERGVRRIRVHLQADNEHMRRLIDRVFGDAVFARDGSMMTGEFPVPQTSDPECVPQDAGSAPLFHLLRLIAEGAVMPVALGLAGVRQGMIWLTPYAYRPARKRGHRTEDETANER